MRNSLFHRYCYLGLFIFLCYNTSSAQSSSGKTGVWLMGFNQTRLLNKWSIHAEAQYRSFEIVPNTDQMLLCGGINYHLNIPIAIGTTFTSIGYAYIANYAFDKEQLVGV